ncbi:hypothetical protein J6590_050332 [Homalodisca vitripennis]|nr:hypothetical protein J6590_050332 [Homalodisca vitripennis]
MTGRLINLHRNPWTFVQYAKILPVSPRVAIRHQSPPMTGRLINLHRNPWTLDFCLILYTQAARAPWTLGP